MEKRVAKVLDIDGKKLNDIILERGLKKEEMSYALGYSKTFINHLIGDSRVRPLAMEALDRLYGIKYDDIRPDEPVVEPEPDENVEAVMESQSVADSLLSSQELWDKLSLVIYAAVTKAVTDALNA